MNGIQVTVVGERSVSALLERLPSDVMQRLEDAMVPLIQRVAAAQKARAPKRTGRLAATVGHTFIDKGSDFIRARSTVVAPTGWQYGKAGALEYGAPGRGGRFTVKEHKRRGRGVGMEVIVDRYQRTQNLIAQRFIRDPFLSMTSEIEATLREAVEVAVREADAA